MEQNDDNNKNKKPKNYMSNKQFLKELLECQKNNKISNKLGEMFNMLITRYASKPNFSGYSYIDEMKANAIVSCCAAYQKFDATRGTVPNPFAFFTTVVHNSFLQVMNKEKKNQRLRDKLLVENNMTPSYSYIQYYEHEQFEKLVAKEEQEQNNEFED